MVHTLYIIMYGLAKRFGSSVLSNYVANSYSFIPCRRSKPNNYYVRIAKYELAKPIQINNLLQIIHSTLVVVQELL